jgi:cytochrome c biogenesis protein CcdA
MIEQLFTSLSKAVEATPVIALFASVIWGVLSIVLSPCHLASIPLIVGFINGQGRITNRRALGLSALFAIGILITIALIGILTALLGRMMGDVGAYGNYIVAVIFFIVGLYLLNIIPMPWAGVGQGHIKRKGLLAALLIGDKMVGLFPAIDSNNYRSVCRLHCVQVGKIVYPLLSPDEEINPIKYEYIPWHCIRGRCAKRNLFI